MKKICGLLVVSFVLSACSGGKSTSEDKSNSLPCTGGESSGSEFGAGIVNGKTLTPMNSLTLRTVLLLFKKDGEVATCTGSILPGNVILTAAHCVADRVQDMKVLFSPSLSCSVTSETVKEVDHIVKNPDYKTERDFDHDVAMVHYVGSLPANYQAFPVPGQNLAIHSDENLIMLGYGRTGFKESSGSGTLRITSNKGSQLSSVDANTYRVEQPHSGVCSGDSGGPLVVIRNGMPRIIGVASAVGNRNRDDDNRNLCSGFAIFVRADGKSEWISDTYRRLTR